MFPSDNSVEDMRPPSMESLHLVAKAHSAKKESMVSLTMRKREERGPQYFRINLPENGGNRLSRETLGIKDDRLQTKPCPSKLLLHP